MQRYMLSLLVVLSATPVAAETVYKSVDDAGHVTYSSTPPSNSVEVEAVPLAPAPSQANVEAAEKNLKQTEKMADELEKQRLEQQEQALNSPSETREESGEGRLEYGGYSRWSDPQPREEIRERRLQDGNRPGAGRPVPLPAPRPAPRAGRPGPR